jgi:glutamate synthase (NADPH/NADH) small chain
LGRKGESVSIGRLERFVADLEVERPVRVPYRAKSTNMRVAVVGAGPAGLTAAAELAKKGHHVTVFEALHVAGGVLVHCIPEFRLEEISKRKLIT